MQYVVIGDEETVLGFSLAGVEGKIANSKEETEKYLNEYIHNPQVGIIIITEKLAAPLSDFINQYTYTESFPLIIQIPDKRGYQRKVSVEEVIRKSVGIKI